MPPRFNRVWTWAARMVAVVCLAAATVQLQYVPRRLPVPSFVRILDRGTLPAFFTIPVLFVIQAGLLFKWRTWRSFIFSAVLFLAAWVATCFVILSALSGLR